MLFKLLSLRRVQLLDRRVGRSVFDSCFAELMLDLLSPHIGNLRLTDLFTRSSARTTCHGGFMVVLGLSGTNSSSNFGVLFQITTLSLRSDLYRNIPD